MGDSRMVEYDVENGIARLTINEPERRNPMSTDTMAALARHMQAAVADPEVRVVVFTGAGDTAFSAGGDLSGGFVDDPVGLHRRRGLLADLFRTMWRGGKPTIARVNGHALAGGFGLAVACDITICVEDAKLGVPEIDVGLWPMMITAALTRCMPEKAALELMMTGRLITPNEALRLGAVSRVVAREELDDVVAQTATTLASKSQAALMIGRDAFFSVARSDIDAALDRLQGGLTAVAGTDDAAEGVRAFLDKRPPEWSDS
jgi:enoyl-CoA hydratase/carnithine racemase